MSKFNLYVNIDLDDVINEVSRKYCPEQIYTRKELDKWAEQNDYVKEETYE
jgi:hypothetical protein